MFMQHSGNNAMADEVFATQACDMLAKAELCNSLALLCELLCDSSVIV